MLGALLFVQDFMQHGGDFLGSWAAGRPSWALGSGDNVEEVSGLWGYGAASEVIPCLLWREWSCQLDQSFAFMLCL